MYGTEYTVAGLAPTRRPTRTSSGAYAHAVEHA
eukprot:COSAG06_NODE_55180_length_291_cov_0.307292_1_plen_32_part_01